MKTIVSIDVETDGSIPPQNSMLSLAAIAYNLKGEELSVFSQNLKPLPMAVQDKRVMDWWKDYPEAWEKTTRNQQEPHVVMNRYVEWYAQFQKPAMFAAPVAFDFLWLRWYIYQFTKGYSGVIWHRALDLRSVIFALTGDFEGEYRELFVDHHITNPLPHVAINDAREQAEYLFAALKLRPF